MRHICNSKYLIVEYKQWDKNHQRWRHYILHLLESKRSSLHEFQRANEWPTNCVGLLFWRSSTGKISTGAPPKNHLPAAYIVPWQLNYHSKPRLFRLVKKILRFRSKGRWIVGELGKRGSWAPVQVDELLQLILNKSLGGFEKYLFGRMSFDFFFLFPSVKRPRPRCQKFILSISLVIKVMENFVGFDKIADLFEFYLVIVEKELYKRDEVIEQTVYFVTRNVRLLRND